MKIKQQFRHSAYTVASALACLAGLTLTSCADDDFGNGGNTGSNKGVAVSFDVSDAQDEAPSSAKQAMTGMPMTRAAFASQLQPMNLSPEDLTLQKLSVQGGDGNSCIIESTTAGIETFQHKTGTNTGATSHGTRANITTIDQLGHFSSYGYKGNSASAISATPDWFYNSDTNPDGTLVNPVYWNWSENHFGKFYGIYPRVTDADTKIKVSPASYGATPYVDFEVEPDVKNQKDLMTACTGVVEYQTPNVAPTSHLRFRHALTAVRFKVGQNLSYDKHITKVEIVGAMSKGKYTLSADATGAGAGWTEQNTPATFTLSGLNVSTKLAVNQILTGNNGDNYTFYMIPQTLTGAGVMVKIYFDGSTTPAISATLTGSWKPGTTKTYSLSQNTSTWQYQLTVANSAAAAFDQTITDPYGITSYREAPDGTQQPVPWKIVGYDNNGDDNFDMNEKPAWLTSLSKEDGTGSTTAETGTATLRTDIVDLLAARNNALKSATPLGSAENPYDLSTKGGHTTRSTANSYVISAPGHYRIPLVYGNAITNGATNEHAYISQAPTGTSNEQYVLRHFKDHAGNDITDPWIEQTNNKANSGINGAKVVWADEAHLVHLNANPIVRSGEETYLQFEVKADDIQNGNAVVAVTKDGTVVWSWHLWFASQDVLNTTACTNYSGHVYNFTHETLGYKHTSWKGSTYSAPRSVRVKVEQTVGQAGGKQVGVFTITQNNGNSINQGYATFYQFGRKDAMPNIDAVREGSFSTDLNSSISIQAAIQHPELFYANLEESYWGSKNLWSADNTVVGFNDNPVVKTIYDPCPAGFKIPASDAFSGFVTISVYPETQVTDKSLFNVSGDWDNGLYFNNKITNPNANIYFPATGAISSYDGKIYNVGTVMIYWGAIPLSRHIGAGLIASNISNTISIYPKASLDINFGISVRPVADE
jgi:hypothetical protein